MKLAEVDWGVLESLAWKMLGKRQLGDEYRKRLKFEIKEINKQGANDYWVRLFREQARFDNNKNGLVLPWLLKMTEVDPVAYEYTYQVCNSDNLNAKKSDIIILELETGQQIDVPADTFVLTARGQIKASELRINDELL